ncbi:MAG: YrbL family protein [Roseobacter sp.]
MKGSTNRREPAPPQFFGFVETTARRGTLWAAICDETGNLAPTIKQLAQAVELRKTIEPLSRFVKLCFKHKIVVPDIRDNNQTLTHRDGRAEIILVDGFGNHLMISLRSVWPPLNNRSLVNRFEKLARQKGLRFDPHERRFVLPP